MLEEPTRQTPIDAAGGIAAWFPIWVSRYFNHSRPMAGIPAFSRNQGRFSDPAMFQTRKFMKIGFPTVDWPNLSAFIKESLLGENLCRLVAHSP